MVRCGLPNMSKNLWIVHSLTAFNGVTTCDFHGDSNLTRVPWMVK
jgi:hypothetical protein